ncbi:MAG: hypothetical protein FWF50_03050 [Defluviitaleaceae bacterium]|nr:hypothetical protein [Defluviitaleaceae bacterium]
MEESELNISLHLDFKLGGRLIINKYSTLDIQRQKGQININLTNNTGNLSFNSLFDEITEQLGEDETFNIVVKTNNGKAIYKNLVADYYNNTHHEILHFGKQIETGIGTGMGLDNVLME